MPTVAPLRLPHRGVRRRWTTLASAPVRPERADTLPRLVVQLQRTVGNAAVSRLVAGRQLMRAPRHPVDPPGKGYDGIFERYEAKRGQIVPRSLTSAEVSAVKDFRNWLESTWDPALDGGRGDYRKGTWAREAGIRTSSFGSASASSRAVLYAEFQRQIIQATGGARSSWQAYVERGGDGSYIFRGNPSPPGGGEERVFVIARDGSCYAGVRSALQGSGAGKMPDYKALTPIAPKPPSGGAGAAGGAAPAGGRVAGPGAPGAKTPVAEPTVKPPAKTPTATTPGSSKVTPGQPKVTTPATVRRLGGAAAIAGGMAVGLLLGFLDAKIRGYFADKQIKRALTALEPQIEAAINNRQSEFNQLLAQTNRSQMIYANIRLDVVWWQMMIDADTPPDVSFHELKLMEVKLSTKNISREDGWDRKRVALGSYLDHRYYITSLPVFNPLDELFEQTLRWLAEHPDSPFQSVSPSHTVGDDKGGGLEWDRIRGKWVQKSPAGTR